MHNTTSSCLHASRLVRCLTEMEISGEPVLPEHFSEKVGRLLDLSGAVALSKMLGELRRPSFNPSETKPAAIKDAFMRERAALVREIIKRLVPGDGSSRNRLPSLEEFYANCILKDVFSTSGGNETPNCAAAFAPYRKHYLTLQGQLGLATHRLRVRTAESIAGLSPVLAGLAALDKGLGDVLYHRQQRFFGRIPTLLEQRFNDLLHTYWPTLPNSPEACDLATWMAPGGWLFSFCGQMQEMLLAELEIRLQPVLGLIESIDETGIGEKRANDNKNFNCG